MKYFVALSLTFITTFLLGQEDDHVNWSFNKYSISLDDKWKLELIPIYRINNNLSTFSNASIDVKLSRALGHGLTAGVLSRTWYFPGKSLRQFLWLDLVHKIPDFGLPVSMKHRLRFHGGADVKDWEEDRDFMRYHFGVFGAFESSFIQPYVGLEPFFRLNGQYYFERLRIEYGIHLRANEQLKFIAFLIHQQMYDFEEVYTQYLWMTGIHYVFPNQLKKRKEIN